MSIALITAPVAEPVTLADLKLQIGLSPYEDGDHVKAQMLSQQLRRFITVARNACETYTRRVFMTQTWQLQRDAWPPYDPVYTRRDNGLYLNPILLPKQPLQSVSSFTYIDVSGTTQDMRVWGFQEVQGSETQPGMLYSPTLSTILPWPPLRITPNAVQVTFRCGYGGPVVVNTTATSNILGGLTVWNPGDVGLALSIPGAAASGAVLNTSIASVDVNGVATLATAATTAVTGSTAFAGKPVPAEIAQAVLFLAQTYYEDGFRAAMPDVVKDLLNPYMNRIC